MKEQPNRLMADRTHHFVGRDIDRSKPLRFRLGGQMIDGFAGDTVLSACLASGITAAGMRNGQMLALDERFAPPILQRIDRSDPTRALPMERTPAIDGADFLLLQGDNTVRGGNPLSGVARVFQSRKSSLDLRFEGTRKLASPWHVAPPTMTLSSELIVVGGGVAGMSAALAANDAGLRVLLVERGARLGGFALLFGSLEGEEPPLTVIDRLVETIRQREGIEVLTHTEALSAHEGIVRVHQVRNEAGTIEARVVDLKAPRIVLATGAIERLPIFPGNRLPGVLGSGSAFLRADRFGLWMGRQSLFSTSSSAAYRLAMMASDVGIAIQRITDSRLSANSRFIEFSKAYGMTLAAGLVPHAAESGKKGRIEIVLANQANERVEAEPIETESLVVSGGWQPDLTLWHMAGGQSVWDPEVAVLRAQGEIDNIALAGTALGYRSITGCTHSGFHAVAVLLGRSIRPVDDVYIDRVFESLDAPAPVAPYGAKGAKMSFLDWGPSLVTRPEPPPRRNLFGSAEQTRWPLADRARALSLVDVVSGVQLKSVPEADAGVVARERSLSAGELVDTNGSETPIPEQPAYWQRYLSGRFGQASIRAVQSLDKRSFTTGALLYRTSDRLGPSQAFGVVVDGTAGNAQVLVADEIAPAGGQVWINDGTRPVAALLSALPPPT